MKIETWDSLTDERQVVEIEDTRIPDKIVKLTDIALGNPIGATEWDGLTIDGNIIIATNTDGSMATYKIL